MIRPQVHRLTSELRAVVTKERSVKPSSQYSRYASFLPTFQPPAVPIADSGLGDLPNAKPKFRPRLAPVEVCRQLGITEQTFLPVENQYVGSTEKRFLFTANLPFSGLEFAGN